MPIAKRKKTNSTMPRDPELFDDPKDPRSPREKLAAIARRSKNERFEEKLAFEIRACRLPMPHRNHKWARQFLSEKGRPREFEADFFFPVQKLIVEVQGGVWRVGGGAHSHPSNIERDIEKQQLAVLAGLADLPITTSQVSSGKGIDILTRALYALGWSPKR